MNAKPISIYRNSEDTKGTYCSLDTIYQWIRTGAKGLAEKTEQARHRLKTAPDTYKTYKASYLPAPTFAGTFPDYKRKANHLAQHSGYMVLDFDDVSDLPTLLAHLAQRPDIVLCFISPSGTGIKLIIRVTPIPTDASEHKAAYNAVRTYLATELEAYDFDFDTSGSDCSRLCYLAYHPQVIYNPEARPIQWDQDAYRQEQKRASERTDTPDFDTKDIDITALDYIHPDTAEIYDEHGDRITAYDVWIGVGIACRNSDVPFEVWDTWSQQGEKYNPIEMSYKWASFGPRSDKQLTWATVIYWAKQNGYVPPRNGGTSQPLLQIDTTQTETRKAQLTAQKEVENDLTADILAFLEKPKTDTPQFMILPHETGTGKSTTVLMRAKAAGKRVLSLLENHELAKQQTETAADIGFTSYRFRGRGYNFEKSKLARLPLAMREQDETLFDKHDVMCPIYDAVEKLTKKRISPLYNCLNCPLLSACKSKGYWSQYAEIQKADYLSVCRADLPFNPDLWAFLNTIQSGKIPFENDNNTESTEEKAIAAMFGLKGDTPTDTTPDPLDFAMMDDYTTSGLYIDATYTIEELADLMHAWRDTTTGDVVETLYRALWELEKHHKKENTAPAIAILRELFENLDADTKALVNENLTKHAYRQDDGQVEPISPWSALASGIKLEDISPVWHSKDWTLLHQIEALLAHCKNDAQAPIFSDKRTITFTIPPQIHPYLNKILFLSATADIEATQAAFSQKQIDWTLPVAKQPQLAKGVQLYQYVDSRMTSGSVFEIEKDANGHFVYDTDNKPKRTGALTPRSREILQQLVRLVKASRHKSLFTSYKEFVEGDFTQIETVKQLHDTFDTITHYDITQGRNFNDYKVFTIFGYPKITLSAIKKEARKQYAHDPKPLSFAYEYQTETKNGYTSTARRFLDPRVEKIRKQLTIDKLKQAIGRARITRWENTIVLCITNEPIPNFTEFAQPLTYKQLMSAQRLQDLENPPPITDPTPPVTTIEKIIKLMEKHPQATHAHIAQKIGITRQAVSISIARTLAKTDFTAKSHIMQQNDTIPMVINSCKMAPLLHDVTLGKYQPKLQEQILEILAKGEAKTAEIINAVDGQNTAIKNELKRLLETGDIVKVKYGVYSVPSPEADTSVHICPHLSTEHRQQTEPTETQTPQPRPPIPSQKPKPQETEIEKPTIIPTQPPPDHTPKTIIYWNDLVKYWQKQIDTGAIANEIKNRNDIPDTQKANTIKVCVYLIKLFIEIAKEHDSKFGVY